MQTANTVDEYIAAQAPQVQPRLREMRDIVRGVLPQASEVISYGMPTYRFPGGSVHFGAARNHCALYGTAMDDYSDELRGYDTSKGTLRFPLDKPIPRELVEKLVLGKVRRCRGTVTGPRAERDRG